jgi:hypothetical protein
MTQSTSEWSNWIERDAADLRRQLRCGPVNFSRDGGMALHSSRVLHGLNRSRGDVHNNIGLVKEDAHTRDALCACFELARLHLGWHVERFERRLIHFSALLQPGAALKVFQRAGQGIIPKVLTGFLATPVAFYGKALAKPLDIIGRSILPEGRRQRGPTAFLSDAPVAFSRLLSAKLRPWLERWGWIIRQC